MSWKWKQRQFPVRTALRRYCIVNAKYEQVERTHKAVGQAVMVLIHY